MLVEEIANISYYKEHGYDYLVTSSWMVRDSTDTYSLLFQNSLEQNYEQIKTFEPTIYFLYDPFAWRVDYDALSQVTPGKPGIGGPIITIYKLKETK